MSLKYFLIYITLLRNCTFNLYFISQNKKRNLKENNFNGSKWSNSLILKCTRTSIAVQKILMKPVIFVHSMEVIKTIIEQNSNHNFFDFKFLLCIKPTLLFQFVIIEQIEEKNKFLMWPNQMIYIINS